MKFGPLAAALLAVAAARLAWPAPVRPAIAGPAAGSDAATVCARCHESQSALAATTGGHAASLDCVACHADRRPGIVGPRHRAVARCGTHHDQVRHPPARRAHAPLRPTRNCLVCHDPHGSPNAHLVRTALPLRAGRTTAVRFDNESGAAVGGFTDPALPGDGVCEVCHRRTDVYRADGHGESHFAQSCVLCHAHTDGFRPILRDANCTICHAAEGDRFAKASAHSARFACSGCHAELTAAAEPGHRRIVACSECHDPKTHAPAGEAAQPCTQCHDPHGTDNAQLVRERIVTTQGGEQPIRFDGIAGRVDGSFASASAPGTGLCEVCHTQTRFYRADGGGEEHFTFSCLPCHRHARGFEPPS